VRPCTSKHIHAHPCTSTHIHAHPQPTFRWWFNCVCPCTSIHITSSNSKSTHTPTHTNTLAHSHLHATLQSQEDHRHKHMLRYISEVLHTIAHTYITLPPKKLLAPAGHSLEKLGHVHKHIHTLTHNHTQPPSLTLPPHTQQLTPTCHFTEPRGPQAQARTYITLPHKKTLAPAGH
jgi:hypothetical protein